MGLIAGEQGKEGREERREERSKGGEKGGGEEEEEGERWWLIQNQSVGTEHICWGAGPCCCCCRRQWYCVPHHMPRGETQQGGGRQTGEERRLVSKFGGVLMSLCNMRTWQTPRRHDSPPSPQTKDQRVMRSSACLNHPGFVFYAATKNILRLELNCIRAAVITTV